MGAVRRPTTADVAAGRIRDRLTGARGEVRRCLRAGEWAAARRARAERTRLARLLRVVEGAAG